MEEKITIYTIANRLELSPGTISKVINHTGNVSTKTREKVLAYIKEIGYVPTTSARMLKSKRTYTIGVVFTDESDVGLEHSFFSSILQHFKTYVEKEGYELSFIVKKLGDNEMSYLQWCKNKKVDGVYIVVGNYEDQGLLELVESDIPCVSTDMIIPGLHSVIGDNDTGVKLVLEYVKDVLNKTNIAFISGPKSSKSFIERCKAFDKYCEVYKLNKVHEDIFAKSYGFTSGYQATKKLIEHLSEYPEVIFVASDDLALGTLKYLAHHNIRVPEDIQVIGYDDINFAKHFTPPLTTVAQDRKLLGEKAGEVLIRLMNDSNSAISQQIKIPVKLIERESTVSNNNQ